MNTSLQILLLLSVVTLGTAIKCFICNSHENKDCYDLPEASRSKYLKNCDTIDEEQGNMDRINYTLCRKLHMFMDQEYTEANPAEDRVHRDCGYVEDTGIKKKKGDCYYKSGYNTRTWVCSCQGDECNSSPSTSLPVVTLLATVLAAFAAQA